MNHTRILRIVLPAAAIWACGKNDSATAPKHDPPNLPAEESVVVNLPQNAPQQVRDYYGQVDRPFKTALEHSTRIKGMKPVNNQATWTWTFLPGGAGLPAVTLKAVALPGDTIHWTISWNGDVGGVVINNWVSAEGKTTSDGKYGDWKFYVFNTSSLDRTAAWRKSDDGVLTINAAHQRAPGPADDVSANFGFLLLGNPDGSGVLQVSQDGVKIFEAIWQASGAGIWAAYDASTGQQIDGGAWGP